MQPKDEKHYLVSLYTHTHTHTFRQRPPTRKTLPVPESQAHYWGRRIHQLNADLHPESKSDPQHSVFVTLSRCDHEGRLLANTLTQVQPDYLAAQLEDDDLDDD